MTEKELKQLFYKRQYDLLWIANSVIGRRLLNYELDLPILQVFPHAYRLDPKKYSMQDKKLRKHYIDRIFCDDRLAKLFVPILTELDLYKNSLILDRKFYPEEINWQKALLHYSGFEKGKYPLFMYVTDTFTANGGGQGRVGASNATYATAQAATTGTASNSTTRPMQFTSFEINRGFAPFNTATIADAATVVSGANTFIRCLVTGKDDNDSDSISVVASTQASNTGLVGDDYDNVGTTKFVTDVTIGAITTAAAPGSANSFQLNASGIANISFTTYSKFAWRTAKDVAAVAPTVGNNNIQMVDDTNLLSVEYTVPSAASGRFNFI